jgi:hypothetical protein
MNRAEIELLIETLDGADRLETNIWRRPLAILWEELKKAQRTRRWIATPILAVAVGVSGTLNAPNLSGAVMFAGVLGTVGLFVMQRILERLIPVLEREERVQALQNYFVAWRDYDDLAERTAT